ncbi:MAG: M56 family metallopeptidase [Saprospiraceae bacterium]
MITYLISVSIVWAIFLLAYQFFYKKSTYFSINRIYLLTTIIAGLIIPLIPNPYSQNSLFEASSIQNLSIRLQEVIIYSTHKSSLTGFENIHWTWLIYLILVFISGVQFVTSVIRILKLIHVPSEKKDQLYLVHLKEDHIPFSFFRTIAIPMKFKGESNYQLILDHEKEHILRGHHWDILFLSILLIVFPFHPFLYWYRKEIKLVHEFQVDASILKNYSERQYASLLLDLSHISSLKFSMIHSLISSPLKSRIMMFHKKSTLIQTLSYSFIPLFFILCFSCASQEKVSKDYHALKYSNVDTITIYDPGTKKEEIQIVQDEFEYYPLVDHMPEFPGGSVAMMKFIGEKMNYPEEMKKLHKEGTTVVSFIVMDSGDLFFNKFVKTIAPEFNNAVSGLIGNMPKWNPGTLNGKKVNVEVILPVKFKLSD